MNVIALDDAEAVTTDGINWCLYVRDNFNTADDEPEEIAHIDNPYTRFGTWNHATGLRRAPVLRQDTSAVSSVKKCSATFTAWRRCVETLHPIAELVMMHLHGFAHGFQRFGIALEYAE